MTTNHTPRDDGNEPFGPAEMTEFSLSLVILLAVGLFLGSMVLRHAEPAFNHAAAFAANPVAQTAG